MSTSDLTAAHPDRSHAVHRDAFGAKLGMWLFLLSEAMLFGGLFVLYAMYRATFPQAFHHGGTLMNGVLGAVNTLVLLSGSAAVAMSVTAVLRNQRRLAVALVGSTVLSGAVFMGIKAVEWTHHLHEGLYPSAAALQGDHGLQMFFALYYTMTGLHGIHVLVGMGLLIWALTLVARGRVTAERVTLLDNVALYWHLVDVIWIFLLGLFYAAA